MLPNDSLKDDQLDSSLHKLPVISIGYFSWIQIKIICYDKIMDIWKIVRFY